jgi:hypothetical protein
MCFVRLPEVTLGPEDVTRNVVFDPGKNFDLTSYEVSNRSRKPRLMAVGIRCADHATPSTRKKLTLTSPTSGGRSVGIVRLRTKATEFSFSLWGF